MTILLFIALLITLSLLLRIQNKRGNKSQQVEVPEHARPSPFSTALQELIATAGGIYLSLVLLVSFLQIDIADQWVISGIKMDPLAFIALVISIIQPLFLRFIQMMKGDT